MKRAQLCFAAAIVVLITIVTNARAQDSGRGRSPSGEGRSYRRYEPIRWYFTSQETRIAFEYQETYGRRLPHPLTVSPCLYGKQEISGRYGGKQIAVPCQFIKATVNQLKQLLQTGVVKYLFPLDVDHAELAVPTEVWEEKYSKLSSEEILPALLKETSLAAVYYPAAHINDANAEPSKSFTSTAGTTHRRTIVAFFDGRPPITLPPHPKGYFYSDPANLRTYGSIYFLAHQLGEVLFTANGKLVSIDISFDPGIAHITP